MEQGEIQKPKDSGKTSADIPDLHRKVDHCILCEGGGVLPGPEGTRCVLCYLILRFTYEDSRYSCDEDRSKSEEVLRLEANIAIKGKIIESWKPLLEEIHRRELLEE
jgi:hypothetical protein